MQQNEQRNGQQNDMTYLRRIAFIGSSVPRQCGIAMFTADLVDSVLAAGKPAVLSSELLAGKDVDVSQLAVTNPDCRYDYPPRVHFELLEKDVASYRRAADFLNVNNFSVVCLQHEYGLYGGPAGSHILAILKDLRMPVITTMHTILREPDSHYRRVTEELAKLSDRLVVMSQRGRDFLRQIYKVPDEKIDVIPHGVPDVPFMDPNFYKDQFGVAGKIVMLTFGLLGPDKGIEYAIRALPRILAKYPNVVYLIVGATHPVLRRHEGEAYRMSLERLAQECSVASNVIFYNRFVSKDELAEFLCGADIYVTPYLNREQITSGTLSYALGAGKAIISTPYWHAEELLADGRGALVPFKDAGAIAAEVLNLLDDEPRRHAMRKRAYMLGRDMLWSRVGVAYVQTFIRARSERAARAQAPFEAKALNKRPRELPPLNLNHLLRMTDGTGIFQHAVFAVPDHNHGYTTDDNARALILTVLLDETEENGNAEIQHLRVRYMAFLWAAFDPQTKFFRNLMSYERRWLDANLPEDGHARALWALGTVLGRCSDEGVVGPAGLLFEPALSKVLEFGSPRTWAFALIGINEYLRRFFGAKLVESAREELSNRLMGILARTRSKEWVWFEDTLTYVNAKLPHALILGGRWMNRPDMLDAGLASLDWLCQRQKSEDGYFVPVGSEGFMRRDGQRARFDQQPVEAHATISACLEAHRTTGDPKWFREAQIAFDWFLGRNDLRLPLYDPRTGGCRDGLHADRVNQNQGAESTLAFLMSWAEMRLSEHVINE